LCYIIIFVSCLDFITEAMPKKSRSSIVLSIASKSSPDILGAKLMYNRVHVMIPTMFTTENNCRISYQRSFENTYCDESLTTLNNDRWAMTYTCPKLG
jgi:hypothetical protein